MYFALEILGTVAFAITGAMAGIKAKMDIFGVTVLGLVTAVGGGIIRDVIIGINPPAAFEKPVYALTAILVSLVVFIPFIRNRINTDSKILNIIDAIGLGVFTVIGVKAGIPSSNPFLQLFLGITTGVGGGVIRDIFAMEKPMIFVRHIYATASLCGAVVCILLMKINEDIAMGIGTAVIVIIRIHAAKFKWHLPKA